MAAPRVEKAYEKYAWILLFLTGISVSPVIFFTLVEGAYVTSLILLGFAVPTVLISATSYRKGKKWAWYLLWYVPVVLVIGIYQSYASLDLGALVGNFLESAVPVLGLLLPYRKFFPRKQVSMA